MSGSAVPPAADTRDSPPVGLAANTIVSSGPQDATAVRRVAQRRRRTAADWHFFQFPLRDWDRAPTWQRSTHEPEPLSVRGKEWVDTAFGAANGNWVELVGAAQIDLGVARGRGHERDACVHLVKSPADGLRRRLATRALGEQSIVTRVGPVLTSGRQQQPRDRRDQAERDDGPRQTLDPRAPRGRRRRRVRLPVACGRRQGIVDLQPRIGRIRQPALAIFLQASAKQPANRRRRIGRQAR